MKPKILYLISLGYFFSCFYKGTPYFYFSGPHNLCNWPGKVYICIRFNSFLCHHHWTPGPKDSPPSSIMRQRCLDRWMKERYCEKPWCQREPKWAGTSLPICFFDFSFFFSRMLKSEAWMKERLRSAWFSLKFQTCNIDCKKLGSS